MSLRDAAQNVLTVWDRRAPGERMEWQREWADALLGLSEALAAERGEGGERARALEDAARIADRNDKSAWGIAQEIRSLSKCGAKSSDGRVCDLTAGHDTGGVHVSGDHGWMSVELAPAPSAPPRAPLGTCVLCNRKPATRFHPLPTDDRSALRPWCGDCVPHHAANGEIRHFCSTDFCPDINENSMSASPAPRAPGDDAP